MIRPIQISRREFLAVAAAVPAVVAQRQGAPQHLLLKGGVVLSLDPRVGDFEKADVLDC